MTKTKKEPEIRLHGEINLDRLAEVLGRIKSKQLGFPVKATIRPMTEEEIEEQKAKEETK